MTSGTPCNYFLKCAVPPYDLQSLDFFCMAAHISPQRNTHRGWTRSSRWTSRRRCAEYPQITQEYLHHFSANLKVFDSLLKASQGVLNSPKFERYNLRSGGLPCTTPRMICCKGGPHRRQCDGTDGLRGTAAQKKHDMRRAPPITHDLRRPAPLFIIS